MIFLNDWEKKDYAGYNWFGGDVNNHFAYDVHGILRIMPNGRVMTFVSGSLVGYTYKANVVDFPMECPGETEIKRIRFTPNTATNEIVTGVSFTIRGC